MDMMNNIASVQRDSEKWKNWVSRCLMTFRKESHVLKQGTVKPMHLSWLRTEWMKNSPAGRTWKLPWIPIRCAWIKQPTHHTVLGRTWPETDRSYSCLLSSGVATPGLCVQFPAPEVQDGCGGTREGPVEGYKDGSTWPTNRSSEPGFVLLGKEEFQRQSTTTLQLLKGELQRR